MRRPGRLDGRTCLIVGGTGGIGLASARRFLEEGARVVVAGHSPEIGRAAMAQLAPLGPVWEVAFELASGAPEVARMFATALDALGGRLDVLLARRRDQRPQVRRRALARMLRRRLGPRHADQRLGRLLDQPRRRPVHAAAAGGRRRPAGHGGERRLGAGPVAVAVAFRDDRLRGQQGGRPLPDARRRARPMPRTGSGSTCWSPA